MNWLPWRISWLLVPGAVLIVTSYGCNSTDTEMRQAKLQSAHESISQPHVNESGGTVSEALTAGSYTFVCVDDGSQSYWLASNPIDVAVGDKLRYEGALVMKDFFSPSLERTFPYVLFVDRAWVAERAAGDVERIPSLPSGHPIVSEEGRKKSPSPPKRHSIPRFRGVLTIAEVYAHRKQLSGTTIKVAGKVMKTNPNIMGKNWIHLQDGTGIGGKDDLTVTTTELAVVGSLVIAEGKVVHSRSLNKGYFFPLLLEDAKLTQTQLTKSLSN